MTGGSKGVYPGVFAGVFLFIFIIGMTSDVSLSASVSRALLAALVFTALVWIVGRVIAVSVFQARHGEEGFDGGANLGGKLDITVEESTGETHPPTRVQPVNPGFSNTIHSQMSSQAQNAVPSTENPAGQTDGNQAGFSPLVARQIDPQVTKIINSDPDKVAEIVRKMGFEEE